MVLQISNNYLQETCFILAIVGIALSITATALHFVAVRRVKHRPGWEDLFSVLATFFFVLYVIPLLYLLSLMNGNSTWTDEEIVNIKKAGYAMGPQFCMQQLFAKLSILFLYYRLFHVNQRFLYCVQFLGIFQTAWSIATYIAHYLECIPPSKLWKPTIDGHCINSAAFLAGGETPNSLVDFALIALAIWMVQTLRVKTSEKLKLFVIFMIGGLAGVLGFVKIGYGFSAVSKSKIEVLDPIWATVQQTCSVICCCAPFYKPLIPDFGVFRYISSVVSKSRSSKSGSNPHPDEMDINPFFWERNRKHQCDDWIQLDGNNPQKGLSSHTLPPV
ncbi:conserved hypothetical protein [Talaromyces stipitatus ATCC 10500]|uniref:Rhodopsin domain-containing protein n=1 Tax=Talaromyces stipitatus (strain ATCC 10500 / CBS 375.48 / QM 6759 / NRRL 1006) TaxID=441959 RepID=B8MT28_TALSN|nr:uncharacterized protein TSTA_001760 [Talaromyces stipitatus ATCC 10500]EED12108.1 conserved hypothetical protein [Talaromyces stipitatus ATCC 10500]